MKNYIYYFVASLESTEVTSFQLMLKSPLTTYEQIEYATNLNSLASKIVSEVSGVKEEKIVITNWVLLREEEVS